MNTNSIIAKKMKQNIQKQKQNVEVDADINEFYKPF